MLSPTKIKKLLKAIEVSKHDPLEVDMTVEVHAHAMKELLELALETLIRNKKKKKKLTKK